MIEGWQAKTLDELCKIARGGSPRPIKEYLTDAPDGVNWIKISDATASTKYIFSTKEKIKPEGVKRSRMVHEGDFLLSNSMSFGRPYIMKTSGCIHDGWLVLTDKSGLLDQDYLYYFLGSAAAYRQFDARASGSTVRNLNIGLVRSVEVPLPPLPEQERIVAILDEAFAAISTATANAEKNLANARELFESELNRVFSQKGDGWSERTLADVSEVFGRGRSRHRPRNADFLYGGDYPFIQTGDIRHSEHVITEFAQTYSEAGLSQSRLWPAGAVCITIAANIAETGILGFDACFPDSVIGMVPDPEVADSGYVEYLLQSYKADLQRQGRGNAQDNINLRTFEGRTFPFAPLPEQQAIASTFDDLLKERHALERVQKRKLTALTELKQSILHKAFTGQLTANPKAADRTLSEAEL